MHLERYPIFQIQLPPEALESNEFRGSRTKFWVRVHGEARSWLMKFPRLNTGEHWAEKIAAEIGNLIGVDCARVELARCEGQEVLLSRNDIRSEGYWQTCQHRLATICESFLPTAQELNDTPDREVQVFHGAEFLQMFIETYDTNLRFGQREHSVKNIVSAMAGVMGAGTSNPMPLWDYELEELASYALLDGLIGNTDRHHENWMIAFIINEGDMRWEVLPSFDHASSLGRELTDDRRRNILESGGMLNYVYRGNGGVFVDSNRQHGITPLRLAKLMCRWRPAFTRATCARIAEITDSQIWDIIDKVPPEFMSDIAKEFAHKSIIVRRAELLRSVR